MSEPSGDYATKSSAIKPLLRVLSDDQVVARVLAGEQHLFELIMRRYNRFLFRICRGILLDQGAAEEAVQETYVRAYFNLSQFRGPTGFSSWLARIACNEALGQTRRASRLQSLDTLSEAQFQELLQTTHSKPNDDMNPERFAVSSETMRLIEHAIDRLPRDYRLVFILRDIEQLSIDQTAAHLQIKPATVKTRLHRARALLQERLSRYLGKASSDAFPFAGKQCDRIVETVFARLAKHR
ncbi:MAG: RNA polymerase sigma factor [Pseudomonadales bacterium]